MAQSDYYPPRLYLLELCFACAQRMQTPLHSLEQGRLGMPRIHQRCFREELFERFDSDLIVTISRNDKVIEQIPLAHWPTRDYGVRLVRNTFDEEDD